MVNHREQALSEMTGPGGPFEVVESDVVGERIGAFGRRHPHLRSVLAASAAHGDLGYVTMGDRTITYAEHLRLVASVAAALRHEYGIGPGDRVAIVSANRPEWPIAFWATVSLGAIVCAGNGWWTADEIAYSVELTEPKLLIGDRARLARIADRDLGVPMIEIESDFGRLEAYAPDAALPDVELAEDDPALILFTSGTTGRSKGATISHRGLIGFVQVQFCNGAVRMRAGAIAAAQARERGEEPAGAGQAIGLPTGQNVTLLTSPMFHVSGLFAGIIMGLSTAGRLVLREGRFDAEDVLRLIEKERVTAWSPLGGLSLRTIDHPSFGKYDTSSLRNVGFGGSPTSPATLERVKAAFPSLGGQLANGYGSSETVASVSSNVGAEYDARPESAGWANPSCEIEIWDEHDQPVPDGVEGEIHVRSPYTMLGYWKNPEATTAVIKRGRWLATGDIGRLDDGFLTINSRARDMILRGGENIYPIEVEQRIDAHPSVTECAIVGVEHDVLGQEVKAIVVPAPGCYVDVAELARWVGESLAPFKVPAHWEIRREPLPRNAAGKVQKTVLTGESAPAPDDHREH